MIAASTKQGGESSLQGECASSRQTSANHLQIKNWSGCSHAVNARIDFRICCKMPEVLLICLKSPAAGSSPGCCLAREESPPYSGKRNCVHYKRFNPKSYKDSPVSARLHPKTGSLQANPKPWFGECPGEWFNPTAGWQVIAMCCPSHNWHFIYINTANAPIVDNSCILWLLNKMIIQVWFSSSIFNSLF